MPETQSEEKKDMLRLCGAELVEVPAAPYSNPNNYQHIGRRLADQLKKTEKNGAIFADQWNNLDNRKAHYVSTGPEIWEQTDGKIDGFICAIGTGGTLAGVSSYLREKKKEIVIGVADPRGAAMYNYSRMARRRRAKASRSPKASASAASRRSSRTCRSTRPTSLPTKRRCRSSSTSSSTKASASAARPASTSPARSGWRKELGPGHTIVTVLCDSGARYQSKLFNPAFLRAKNLPVPEWLERAAPSIPQALAMTDPAAVPRRALPARGGGARGRRLPRRNRARPVLFYPRGGGQPGDQRRLVRADGAEIEIVDTV